MTVFNRGAAALEKAEKIGEKMKKEGVSCSLDYHPLSAEELLTETIRQGDILIHATSVGMAPMSEGQSLVTDMRAFHEDLVVYDVIYNPEITKLMKDAAENGCRKENIIGGKGMLLWQGACAFQLFSGLEMPVHELKEFLEKREKEGIPVLRDIVHE